MHDGRAPRHWKRLYSIVIALVAVVATLSIVVVYFVVIPNVQSATEVTLTGVNFNVGYASNALHEEGGPSCRNCPVSGVAGTPIAVQLRMTYQFARQGGSAVNITQLNISSPFHLDTTTPAMPIEVFGVENFTVIVVASSGGSYVLGGSVNLV